MKFYINGWEESMEYFMRIGHFSAADIKRMALDGSVVEKNGNRFYVEF
jgi:hypothetical protein